MSSQHVYEVHPSKDKPGADLIFDYDLAGNAIETHEHAGDFKEW